MTVSIFTAAIQEVARARSKFPSSDHITLAFAEEAGEVVKAVLDFKQGKGTMQNVEKEIIQTMAMCLRLYLEGDPSVNLPPSITYSCDHLS